MNNHDDKLKEAIGIRDTSGCRKSLSGCLWIFVVAGTLGFGTYLFTSSAIRITSGKKYESFNDKHVAEQDGALMSVQPDTIKIGRFHKAYIPLLKKYSDNQRQ